MRMQGDGTTNRQEKERPSQGVKQALRRDPAMRCMLASSNALCNAGYAGEGKRRGRQALYGVAEAELSTHITYATLM